MSAPARTSAPGPLLVSRAEAAAMLGMSVESAERYVFGELRAVQVGRRALVPVADLERWVQRNARRALEADR